MKSPEQFPHCAPEGDAVGQSSIRAGSLLPRFSGVLRIAGGASALGRSAEPPPRPHMIDTGARNLVRQFREHERPVAR